MVSESRDMSAGNPEEELAARMQELAALTKLVDANAATASAAHAAATQKLTELESDWLEYGEVCNSLRLVPHRSLRAQDGDVAGIERAVDAGVNINCSNQYGQTALHFAVANG